MEDRKTILAERSKLRKRVKELEADKKHEKKVQEARERLRPSRRREVWCPASAATNPADR